MADRLGWTRDQLLVALRLYMRSPFGRLHGRNPEIIQLAAKIGRTPSALAMKACNFASLDPAFLATRRKGLSGASEADRAVWAEFAANPEQVALPARFDLYPRQRESIGREDSVAGFGARCVAARRAVAAAFHEPSLLFRPDRGIPAQVPRRNPRRPGARVHVLIGGVPARRLAGADRDPADRP